MYFEVHRYWSPWAFINADMCYRSILKTRIQSWGTNECNPWYLHPGMQLQAGHYFPHWRTGALTWASAISADCLFPREATSTNYMHRYVGFRNRAGHAGTLVLVIVVCWAQERRAMSHFLDAKFVPDVVPMALTLFTAVAIFCAIPVLVSILFSTVTQLSPEHKSIHEAV